jgi:hypothetical protein
MSQGATGGMSHGAANGGRNALGLERLGKINATGKITKIVLFFGYDPLSAFFPWLSCRKELVYKG